MDRYSLAQPRMVTSFAVLAIVACGGTTDDLSGPRAAVGEPMAAGGVSAAGGARMGGGGNTPAGGDSAAGGSASGGVAMTLGGSASGDPSAAGAPVSGGGSFAVGGSGPAQGGRAGSGGSGFGNGGRTGLGSSGSGGSVTFGGAGSAGTPGKASRPSYNTGSGFFTLKGKLYDANGVEFQIKGLDTVHYDESWASCSSNCGIANSHSNVNRMGVPLWPAISTTTLQNLMNRMIAQHIVPMPGVWYVDGSYADSSNVTCQENAGPGSAFASAVSQWVARQPLFKPFEKHMLLNIANEWGPSNSVVWRDAYISAVGTLRQAGYLCTLVIDAGGCGQDVDDIIKYAQAIYDSDPQHNIVFDEHLYGQWATKATGEASWQTDLSIGFDQMQATGLPILIGEFGPGKDVGASPTMMAPGTIIQAANAHGFGWLAWAWDDGHTGFELSKQGSFALSAGTPSNGNYPNNTDLTAYGNEVVLNPSYGTFAKATPATTF